jgi:capsid portal protein
VREFQDGQSPEAIRSAFPTLTLEQVYGAITFYLGHKEVVDRDVADRERTGDAFTETRQAPAELKDKLERARRKISSR